MQGQTKKQVDSKEHKRKSSRVLISLFVIIAAVLVGAAVKTHGQLPKYATHSINYPSS